MAEPTSRSMADLSPRPMLAVAFGPSTMAEAIAEMAPIRGSPGIRTGCCLATKKWPQTQRARRRRHDCCDGCGKWTSGLHVQPERFRRNRWSGGCRHPPSRFGLPNLRPAALFVIRRQDLNTGRSDVEHAFQNSLRARDAILSSHTSTTFLPKYQPSSTLTAADTGGRACYAFAPCTRRSFPASLLAASSDRRLRFRVCIDIAELTSEPNHRVACIVQRGAPRQAAQPCVRAPLHQLGNGFPPLFGLNTQVPCRAIAPLLQSPGMPPKKAG